MSQTVALIDSGVNANHPHILDRGGIVQSWLIEKSRDGWSARALIEGADAVGHGTAAAAAMLDLAPNLRIESIQVFQDRDYTEFDRILYALDHALELKPDVCNLSLGSTNENWNAQLHTRVPKFFELGIPLVAPAFWHGLPSYPGCLEGCCGVRVDAELERESPQQRAIGGREDWFASPYPRELPGLPRAANLAGVSMACANLSGYLLRRLRDRS